MKQIIQIVVAIVLILLLIIYSVSNLKPIYTYQEFADKLYKLQFNKAKKYILDTAQNDFAQACDLFQNSPTLVKVRDDRLNPPVYKILQTTRTGINKISFTLEQTVPAKLPGSNSVYGNFLNIYTHEAEMRISFFQWKVAQFKITPKKTAEIEIPDFGKAIQDGLDRASRQSDLEQATVKALSKGKSVTQPVAASKTPSTASGPAVPDNLKTFELKNGTTVRGKVVLDDPVYYTIETEEGKQVILIKEDIAQS